jgi:hypothetical protein
LESGLVATLATFRSSIANRLGLDNSVSGDQGFIDGWVNDGINQLLMDTGCYQTSQVITPGASADYVLGTNVLEIIDLAPTVTGFSYGMERLSVGELLQLRRNAGVASASPTLYYALAGNNTLLFYPTPAAADTFTMYYVPVPTALSVSSDDPSTASLGGIPVAFHKAIEFYACSEAADANDDASSQEGAKYFQLYQDQVKKIRRTLRRRGGSLMPRARVGPRGPRGFLRYVNHDNSVY